MNYYFLVHYADKTKQVIKHFCKGSQDSARRNLSKQLKVAGIYDTRIQPFGKGVSGSNVIIADSKPSKFQQ